MAFQQQCRRRGSSIPSPSLDQVLASSTPGTDTEAITTAVDEPSPASAHMPIAPSGWCDNTPLGDNEPADSMPPPPPPGETSDTRSTRSTSTTSRTTNRLSLTLPIAAPDSMPSRPTPSSSIPPTPIESASATSMPDPNDLIVAIAAQERRVMELREELGQAEGELTRLKKQFTIADSQQFRPAARNSDPLRSLADNGQRAPTDDDSPSARRSTDLSRRRSLLLAQGRAPQREHKRTVIRGGHTRALSLLSPTKPTADISVHEDADVMRSPVSTASADWNPRPIPTPLLNKRATWAPRQSPQPQGVKQIASDFRQGLWTFVEDLRQATVGDEAISATSHRTTDMNTRLGRTNSEQDTIRASSANRPRIPFSPESSNNSESESPTRPSPLNQDRFHHRRSASRPEPRARKHFSWTPLTFDQFDDDDWSSWDSPTVKQSRWSGSTVNGDIIPAIPERADENEGSLRHKRSKSELRSSSPSPSVRSTSASRSGGTLEELPQALLNRLAPINIKKSAADFMKDWEKSLSPPGENSDDNNGDDEAVEERTGGAFHKGGLLTVDSDVPPTPLVGDFDTETSSEPSALEALRKRGRTLVRRGDMSAFRDLETIMFPRDTGAPCVYVWRNDA